MNIKNAKFLITGSSGQLAEAFIANFEINKIDYVAPEEKDTDITSKEMVETTIDKVKPDVLINCAAYNKVDQAEKEPEIAYAVNSVAIENLARICKAKGIFFIHYSSDYVFDGETDRPYKETNNPSPINVYGKSKLEGERRVREVSGGHLIFRLSWVYGKGKQNFFYKLNRWAEEKDSINIACDEISVPTYAEDIVNVTLKALAVNLTGLYHLVSSGYVSRYELAQYYFNKLKIKIKLNPVKRDFFKTLAKRPRFSAMSNKKLSEDLNIELPKWENALDRFINI